MLYTIVIILVVCFALTFAISMTQAAKIGSQEEETTNILDQTQDKNVDITKINIPQWKNYTIAVDFDKTLCNSKFPECGPPIVETVNFIKKAKKAGCKIILWTCRAGEDLTLAINWCHLYGIPLDAVNENLPEHIEYFGSETRKVYANLYIDDSSINPNLNTFPEVITK